MGLESHPTWTTYLEKTNLLSVFQKNQTLLIGNREKIARRYGETFLRPSLPRGMDHILLAWKWAWCLILEGLLGFRYTSMLIFFSLISINALGESRLLLLIFLTPRDVYDLPIVPNFRGHDKKLSQSPAWPCSNVLRRCNVVLLERKELLRIP